MPDPQPRSRAAARRRLLAAAAASTLALGAGLVAPPRPRLVWNGSPSSAVGLYWVEAAGSVRPRDTVVAWPPAQVRELASVRHYLPRGVPLVKSVAAVGPGRVCAVRGTVFVAGRPAAVQLESDRSGRPLPRWTGCEALGEGDLFLLSQNAESFDGRYFGVTHAAELIGEARLLWPR